MGGIWEGELALFIVLWSKRRKSALCSSYCVRGRGPGLGLRGAFWLRFETWIVSLGNRGGCGLHLGEGNKGMFEQSHYQTGHPPHTVCLLTHVTNSFVVWQDHVTTPDQWVWLAVRLSLIVQSTWEPCEWSYCCPFPAVRTQVSLHSRWHSSKMVGHRSAVFWVNGAEPSAPPTSTWQAKEM